MSNVNTEKYEQSSSEYEYEGWQEDNPHTFEESQTMKEKSQETTAGNYLDKQKENKDFLDTWKEELGDFKWE